MDTKEQKEPNRTEILKPRSYVACLREGLGYPFTHFAEIFRFQWPVALLVALLVMACKVAETAIVLRAPYPQLTPASWGGLAVLEAVAWLLTALVGGLTVYQQRGLIAEGRLPGGRPWRMLGRLRRPTLRMLLFGVVSFLLLAGAAALLTLSAVMHRPWMVLGSVVPVALFVALTPALLHYLYTDDGLLRSLAAPLLRYLGRTVAVLLVGALVAGLALLVVAMPYLLVSAVDMLVARLTATGDVPMLPVLFPLLRAVTAFLFAFLGFFVSMMLSYPLLFHWGAYTAIEQERQEAAA